MKPRATWSRQPLPPARLVRVLENHRGVGRAIRAKDLAMILGIRESYPDRVIREAVNAAIEAGWPIGSVTHNANGDGGGGYFLIQTEAELEEVLTDYRARVRGIERKMSALVEAFRQGPRQPSLGIEAGWPTA